MSHLSHLPDRERGESGEILTGYDDLEVPRSPGNMLKRIALAAAAAFISINLWTGAPLLALWIGSQTVGSTILSMKAVGVVVVVLAILVFGGAMALGWLNASYERLTGRPPRESRVTWLRGMGVERGETVAVGMSSNALERIVMVTVYVAVIALLVWFFAFAGSPLPH
jgi:hypothetical protein